ncbi:MAG: cyclic-di-AMP phosphodiesterase PgpH, partial [Bacteroidota bacterium]|nr:cyclic-di-AMP phosphodiesterase PgpH [Bacteroidota bacterium]
MANSNETMLHRLIAKRASELKQETKTFRNSLKTKSAIILITVLACTAFFSIHINREPNKTFDFGTSPGYIWSSQAIYADFSFPIYKPLIEYQREVADAKRKALHVFILDEDAQAEAIRKLQKFSIDLTKITTESNLPVNDIVNEKNIKDFASMPENAKIREENVIYNNLKKVLLTIYQRGFINLSKDFITNEAISVRILPTGEKLIKKAMLYDSVKALELGKDALTDIISKPGYKIATEILAKSLSPNLVYSKELSETAVRLAANSVPRTIGIVRKGDNIIDKGEKITEETLMKLNSYDSTKMLKSGREINPWMVVGSFGHSLI